MLLVSRSRMMLSPTKTIAPGRALASLLANAAAKRLYEPSNSPAFWMPSLRSTRLTKSDFITAPSMAACRTRR
jgi:hypothetical protein